MARGEDLSGELSGDSAPASEPLHGSPVETSLLALANPRGDLLQDAGIFSTLLGIAFHRSLLEHPLRSGVSSIRPPGSPGSTELFPGSDEGIDRATRLRAEQTQEIFMEDDEPEPVWPHFVLRVCFRTLEMRKFSGKQTDQRLCRAMRDALGDGLKGTGGIRWSLDWS